MDFLGIAGIGIAAFAATDIDDLFVLMLFFSNPSYKPRKIILGQYLGIGALVAVGVVGSLIALIVPATIVGLMGLLPIAIGIKKLLETRKKGKAKVPEGLKDSRKSYTQFLTVAVVTIANGGDNIGVYVPLFANNNTVEDMALLVLIFLAVTAAWCALAYYLVNHRLVAARLSRVGHVMLPFVLIGLGTYVLADAFLVG